MTVAGNVLKDGWVVNDGEMPVWGEERVDTRWIDGTSDFGSRAEEFDWKCCGPTHWKKHDSRLQDVGKGDLYLENAYDHLNTGAFDASVRMSAAEYIKSLEPLIDEHPIGLPLSRVCKAFEAITGKPMSEEHAETFLKVVEMCKMYATTEDDF